MLLMTALALLPVLVSVAIFIGTFRIRGLAKVGAAGPRSAR
ncbi:MAG TPA: hypothetical protein VK524_07530 [Polyangiaceae bacterium]|nr:hypothetical protein [Polyangiaceae bacterium]